MGGRVGGVEGLVLWQALKAIIKIKIHACFMVRVNIM